MIPRFDDTQQREVWIQCAGLRVSVLYVRFAVRVRSMPTARATESQNMSETQKGVCFCGAVEIEVTGAPEAMGYCHCESCRSWSAGPVNAFTLFKNENVAVTKGEEFIGHFKKTERSDRQFCRECGGHLMTGHPHWGLIDVYAATIPGQRFLPGVHVNYAETVLPMKDGLPKMRDFPAEMGGSGESVAE